MTAAATFTVTWMRDPFSAACEDVPVPVGRTILEAAEVFNRLPLDRWYHLGVAYLGGTEVDPRFWRVVRPKAGTHLVLRMVPGNGGRRGGGVKSALGTVVSIAALLSAAAISGGALGPAGLALLGPSFAAGQTGAQLAAAGVGIVGAMAGQALSATPAPGRQRRGPEGGTASASANLAVPNGSLPWVPGERRFAPPALVQPLVTIVGDDEYVEGIVGVAGWHEISDIEIGGVDEDQIDDLEIQVLEGGPDDDDLTLVTRYSHTATPGVELSGFDVVQEGSWNELVDQDTPANSGPRYHSFTSAESWDEWWWHLYYPEGVVDGSGSNSGEKFAILPHRIEIRRRGNSWRKLPEIHLLNRLDGLVKRAIRFVRTSADAPVARPRPDVGFRHAFAEVDGGAIWEADSYFYAGSGDVWLDEDNWNTAGSGTTGIVKVWLREHEVVFYLDPEEWPDGVYEGRLKVGSLVREQDVSNASYAASGYDGATADLFAPYSDGGTWKAPRSQEGLKSKAQMVRVSSIKNDPPVVGGGVALVAFRARNRNVSEVTALFGAMVPDWDAGTETWSDWKTTKNPAPHFRYVLAGDLNKNPVVASRILDDDLLAWRASCASKGYEVSAIFDGRSVDDVLDVLAAAGRAVPYRSEVYGIVEDRDRSEDPATQMFSPRNAAEFRRVITYTPNRPHAIRARFDDEADGYRPAVRTIYDAGRNEGNSTLYEEIEYPYLTKASLVDDRAAYDLAVTRKRATTYSLVAPHEAVECRAGDLVAVQHDTIHRFAGYGRVRSKVVAGNGKVVALRLDDDVPVKLADPLFGVNRAGRDRPLFADPDAPLFGTVPGSAGLFADPDAKLFRRPGGLFDTLSRLGAVIRCHDGSQIACEIAVPPDDARRIDILTSFADPGGALSEGCLVTTGVLGKEARRLIVTSMKPGQDFTWSMEFVDEAPEIFA